MDYVSLATKTLSKKRIERRTEIATLISLSYPVLQKHSQKRELRDLLSYIAELIAIQVEPLQKHSQKRELREYLYNVVSSKVGNSSYKNTLKKEN